MTPASNETIQALWLGYKGERVFYPQDPAALINATDALVFTPPAADVRAGDIVEWDNTGSIGHTVTFDSAAAAASNDLAFSAGDKLQVRFPTAGTYSYTCTLHSGMTGTITVH